MAKVILVYAISDRYLKKSNFTKVWQKQTYIYTREGIWKLPEDISIVVVVVEQIKMFCAKIFGESHEIE